MTGVQTCALPISADLHRPTRRWPYVPRLALTALGSAALACATPDCTNQIVQTISSPDGTLRAVTYLRRCGDAPTDATHLSIVPATGRSPRAAGNVARVADTGSGEPVARSGTKRLAVEWVGTRQLVVRYDARAVLVRREPPPEGVYVLFVPVRDASTAAGP